MPSTRMTMGNFSPYYLSCFSRRIFETLQLLAMTLKIEAVTTSHSHSDTYVARWQGAERVGRALGGESGDLSTSCVSYQIALWLGPPWVWIGFSCLRISLRGCFTAQVGHCLLNVSHPSCHRPTENIFRLCFLYLQSVGKIIVSIFHGCCLINMSYY